MLFQPVMLRVVLMCVAAELSVVLPELRFTTCGLPLAFQRIALVVGYPGP
jgi:hypothetical protein